ncbi:hypothetical protein [Aggregatibacter actinomycetemcomitans]|uniref:hypothetical protein n=1 Tax=Aggregatibacter actinomycetemcomitans TaxID=714 RepID=UPI00023FEC0F|nr:hypothetical protein [Aggregatibacter actinomycetemcomitans]EHK89839.1 hypothetical protein RHAA1_10896 [Aggregatibacter actinomycetemcomitans RhAA1]KNE76933.1 hypothetical protein RHAA2_11205 [Aggregatibacter actinomycetemcomitans RhAA1]
MLKEIDLIEDHEYVSKNVTVAYGAINKRRIFKVDHIQGYVTYCDIKHLRNGMKASVRTVSIKSFLKWACADITRKDSK